MLATIASSTLQGIRGCPIAVEVHVSSGLPSFTVVGLPDTSCREARDRVRAAILTSGLDWPQARVTVNLAPSGVPKTGAGLDLAIAVGVLCATEQLTPEATQNLAFVAELGLDGSLRPVPGALPLTAALEVDSAVIAPQNIVEAALVTRRRIRSVRSLRQLVDVLTGQAHWPRFPPPPDAEAALATIDMADVQGQELARRAAEVAAAGGHHMLLAGPPGAGKTMIAKAVPGLLPPLTDEEALDVTTIHSAAGLALPAGGLVRTAPFRAPHHTSSLVSLIGGGTRHMRPGEISCASGGVLFLDELGEFPAVILDSLRQPLEEGQVRVARAYGSVTFPANFLLVGATNPCPCGDAKPGAVASCRCSDAAIHRYLRRLSGPLLDRFDLRVQVSRPNASELFSDARAEASADIATRVSAARSKAIERGGAPNAAISTAAVDEIAPLETSAKALLVNVVEDGRLSARGVHRVRCVARTVADLAGHQGPIAVAHVAAALAMRAPLLPPMPGAS